MSPARPSTRTLRGGSRSISWSYATSTRSLLSLTTSAKLDASATTRWLWPTAELSRPDRLPRFSKRRRTNSRATSLAGVLDKDKASAYQVAAEALERSNEDEAPTKVRLREVVVRK